MSFELNSVFSSPQLDQSITDSVSFLQPVSKKMETEDGSLVTEPREFFKAFGVSEKDIQLFKPGHIQQLYGLIKKHGSFSNMLCLHDLFGFEFYSIFEDLRGHLSDELWKTLQKEWIGYYLLGYYGLIRQLDGELEIPNTAREMIFLPKDYAKAIGLFSKKLKEELLKALEKKIKAFPKMRASHDEHRQQIDLLMKRWETNRMLLSTFLLSSKAGQFLAQTGIYSYPGTQTEIKKDIIEVQLVIQNLKRYIDLMTLVHSIHDHTEYFRVSEICEIQRDIQELAESKDSREIVEKAVMMLTNLRQSTRKLSIRVNWAVLRVYEARSISPQLEESQFESLILIRNHLKLYSYWIGNIRKILEPSVLLVLDSSAPSTVAYLNRIVLNLSAHLSEGLPEDSSESSSIRRHWLSQFKPQLMGKTLEVLDLYFKNELTHAHVYPFLDTLFKEVKEATLIARKQFSKIESYQDKLWACRLFILENDLQVLLGEKEPDEESCLPEELLRLLPKEEKTPSSSPSPEPIASLTSQEEVSSLTQSPELEILPVREELAKPTIAETKESPPPRRISSPSPTSSDSLDEILNSRKPRNIERILKDLGMQPIRSRGSHQTWSGGGLQTVLPKHKELATGTLHAIHAQLRKQLEEKKD